LTACGGETQKPAASAAKKALVNLGTIQTGVQSDLQTKLRTRSGATDANVTVQCLQKGAAKATCIADVNAVAEDVTGAQIQVGVDIDPATGRFIYTGNRVDTAQVLSTLMTPKDGPVDALKFVTAAGAAGNMIDTAEIHSGVLVLSLVNDVNRIKPKVIKDDCASLRDEFRAQSVDVDFPDGTSTEGVC
jgi:copper chaperone CopZ